MKAEELLRVRASNGKLEAPAPSPEVLHTIVEDALRAPDHAALRPWRIFEIKGEARKAFGDLMVRSLLSREPDASEAKVEKMRSKAFRAPTILVVAAVTREHPKVPEIEQVVSAGAVVHGILLGLQARGYARMWRTGATAYDGMIKEAFGLQDKDHLVGFLYLGTPSSDAPRMRRPTAQQFIEAWPV